ncbi:MAG TPA: endolytic transglycosylase MltG [Stenomitos sp.]
MRAIDWLRSQSLRTKLLLAGAGAFVALGLVSSPLLPAGRPGAPVRYVTVGAGRDLYRLAATLQQRRIVRNRFAFALLARAMGAQARIRPGTYALSPGQSPFQIVSWLMDGRGLVLKVTVPEGYSIAKIARMLEAKGLGKGSTFRALAEQPARFLAHHAWLKDLPAGASLEGFLFPDTYLFSGGQLDESMLIDRMLGRFEAVVGHEYGQTPSPLMPLYQAVTMASIIELEAVRPEERPLISGVFQNRLRIGMRLGSDPTVEYALGRHQGEKGLSFKDVRVDSPYNTYRYAGLPPGPIGNPGLASFKAALHPETTDYLYFVARGDGTHAFTRTYADHLAAQRRLRP